MKLSPACIRCKKNCVAKQDMIVQDENDHPQFLYKKGQFAINCQGIPADYQEYINEKYSPEELSSFSSEERDQIEQLLNPVKWAEKNLCLDKGGWVPRKAASANIKQYQLPPDAADYQDLMLKCTAARSVARIGRRSGKSEVICVKLLHAVFTNNNFRILLVTPYLSQIGLIFKRIEELIGNSPTLKGAIKRNVASPQHEIEFWNGSSIIGFTSGTKSGGKADSVRGQRGDLICFTQGTLVNTSEFGIRPIETLTLQDTVLGGNEDGVEIGGIDALFKREAEVISISTPLNHVQCTPNHPIFNGTIDVSAETATEAIVSMATQELTFSREAIMARLTGYLYGDGWLTVDGNVGFSGQKKDLEQIVEDIVLLGGPRLHPSERFVENTERGIRGIVSQIATPWGYPLFKEICPIGKKVTQPLSVPEWIRKGKFFVKENFLSALFSAESTHIAYQTNKKSLRTIEIKMRSTKPEWLAAWFGDLQTMLNEIGIKTSPIKISTIEDKYQGSISVNNSKENIDRFVEKIGFCYNFTKTQSANIWKLYRWYLKQPGVNQKTTKPYDVYAKYKIWDGYVKLPVIASARRKIGVKTVYNLTSQAKHRYFGNGFMTHNCLDEADYLDPDSIDSIIQILSDHKDVKLWASSTPTGARSRFYGWCHNALYKEFHFPSMVNPNWGPQMELELREVTSEMGYQHEVLALFSEAQAGVFQKRYIDNAVAAYAYKDILRDPARHYMIGVDWNPIVGTEILVLEARFENEKVLFRTVDVQTIGKVGFKQAEANMRIVEMNRKWRPEAIYVDKGGGGYNHIEQLELFSAAAQLAADKKIKHIIHGVDFGSAIEMYDPWNKMKVKKPIKPVLVENLARRLEQGFVELSTYDTLLIKQLTAYVIKRLSPSGQPVYESEDPENIGDHRLDALMLAMFAFTMEKTEFGHPVMVTGIAFTGKIGEKITKQSVINKQQKRPQTRTKNWESRSAFSKGLPGDRLTQEWGSENISPNPSFQYDRPSGPRTLLTNRGRRPTRANI